MVPDGDGDDDHQPDVEHDRRRKHSFGVLIGQIEEACQIEGAAQSNEYAAEHSGTSVRGLWSPCVYALDAAGCYVADEFVQLNRYALRQRP